MNKKIILLLFALLSLFSFLVLSKYEDRSFMRTLDFSVTVKVQEKIDSLSHLRLKSLIDTSMTGATFFASPEFTSVVIILLTGWALFDWKKKKFHLRALVIPVAFVVIVFVELYGKSIVHHPSPPFSMIKHATSIFPANYINEQFSYPSGHAARAVFASLIFYILFILHNPLDNKTRRLFVISGLLFYIFIVSISRIYLGHHWFSDVVGGLFLGLGAFCIVVLLNSIYE